MHGSHCSLLEFFLSFRTLSLEVTEQNSSKLCHVFSDELDLKNECTTCGVPFPKMRGPKNCLFSSDFTATANKRLKLECEF